ncbi:FIST N-terminal domain-containing protein [Anaerovibrio sp.]|uniref:FIST N-terminal domain-containing protein n=1 Tax=Anaerovibrio sp. TaxID=1872532 RepID=UPI003F1754BC
MKSVALFTDEIDDLDVAIDELVSQFGDFRLEAHSAGLLFAHPDTDLQELADRLQDRFGLPIIGTTAVAMFTMEGFKKEGISLQILTSADCGFHVGCTDELTPDNARREITALYNRLTAGVDDDDVKLVLAYGNPTLDMMGEDFVDTLDELSKGTAVYGGQASDSFVMDDCRVVCGSQVRQYALALIVVTGRAKKIIHYGFNVASTLDYEGTVTELQGNMVMKLDGVPLAEAIAQAGISINTDINVCDYVSTPFRIRYRTEDGEEIEMMRQLAFVDKETGGGMFLGKVPLGANVQIGIISKEDIHDSVEAVARDALSEVRQNPDYGFSTVIITSCASRLMSYANDIELEAQGYVHMIPEGMSMSGFYSFGEICPGRTAGSHREKNAFHNTTFTMLVM